MPKKAIPADAGQDKADLEKALPIAPAEPAEADCAPADPNYEFSTLDMIRSPQCAKIRRRSATRRRKGLRIIKTEREYQEAFEGYLQHLEQWPNVTDMGKFVKVVPEPPSVVDFAKYLGCTRQTLYGYEREEPPQGEEWLRDLTIEFFDEFAQRRASRAMRRVYDGAFVARLDRLAEVVEQTTYVPPPDAFADLDAEAESLLEEGEGVPPEFNEDGEKASGD